MAEAGKWVWYGAKVGLVGLPVAGSRVRRDVRRASTRPAPLPPPFPVAKGQGACKLECAPKPQIPGLVVGLLPVIPGLVVDLLPIVVGS